MSTEKMPKTGGRTKPVDKPVDSVDKPAKKKIKKSKTAPKKTDGRKNNGGKGKGGMPKGYHMPATMERLVAKRHMIGRIVQGTDGLLNAQMLKARGEQFLMCRVEQGKGREKRIHTEVIEDVEILKQYFIDMGESLNAENNSDEYKEYYYISTKPADNMAIQSLFDRAYGKATEKVELGGKDEGDLSELGDEDLDARINKYLQRRQRTK